jgi:hypothetical protein
MTTTPPYNLEVVNRRDGKVLLDLAFQDASNATGHLLNELKLTRHQVGIVSDSNGKWMAYRCHPPMIDPTDTGSVT